MPSWNLLTSQKGGKTRQTEKADERKKDGREGKKKIKGKKERERNRKRSPKHISKPWLSLYRDPGANIPDGIFPEAGGALTCTASHHLGC